MQTERKTRSHQLEKHQTIEVHDVVDVELVLKVLQDPDGACLLSQSWLVDARATKLCLSGAEVHQVAEETEKLATVIRFGRSAIVTSDRLSYGVARMY